MNRDRRLTGNLRGQTDSPFAPTGYELNNPWRVWPPKRPKSNTWEIADDVPYRWRNGFARHVYTHGISAIGKETLRKKTASASLDERKTEVTTLRERRYCTTQERYFHQITPFKTCATTLFGVPRILGTCSHLFESNPQSPASLWFRLSHVSIPHLCTGMSVRPATKTYLPYL